MGWLRRREHLLKVRWGYSGLQSSGLEFEGYIIPNSKLAYETMTYSLVLRELTTELPLEVGVSDPKILPALMVDFDKGKPPSSPEGNFGGRMAGSLLGIGA
jgi:hypothetical protein